MSVIELRTYALTPGSAKDFLRVMHTESVPLQRRFPITVLGYGIGADLADPTAYLLREFDSPADHRDREEAFYASSAWRTGPREAIVSRIVSAHALLLDPRRDAALVEALRR